MINVNTPLTGHFSIYLRLAKIVVVMVLGSVEDERMYSSLSFLKSRLHKTLSGHLNVVVGMFSQKLFELEEFPYEEAYNLWYKSQEGFRYGS